ncbi:hypothetical protein KEC48_08375 [Clostridium sp. C1]|uniref:hypothetical protein n=1 Tax=Clostridium sp. C1 TaxID=1155388 RepID=UPI001BAA5D24|nr:hypothetical protein [Clostridium sp. C1]QUN11519.1 hypothetical protein KEC48_08375 [Clostridium sp. C1]
MGNLFGKFTLYDIISMTIPGFLVMLGVCLVIPGTVHQFVVSVDNSWFIFVIGISVSYSVGWIISEISKCIIKVNLKCKKGLCVSWGIVFLVDFGMFYALSQMNFRSYSCFIKIILVGIIVLNFILFIISCCYWKSLKDKEKNQKKKDEYDKEYSILMEKCYGYLNEEYPGFDKQMEGETDIIKKVEVMAESADLLIQTDDKYHRLHNYSSSKSFSKNMGTVCLFWIGILLYQLFYNSKDICFAVVYTLGILFLLFSFVAMQKRYKRFKKKMEVLIVTYYLDFLENKKNKDSNYNTNQFDLNLNINNHDGRKS